MRTFTDDKGGTWTVRLDIGALERCAAEGIMLDEVLSGKSNLLIRLRYDAPLIGRTLAAICRPQFPENGVNDQGFMALLGPAKLAQAKALLRDEIVDFFSQFDPEAARPLTLWLQKDRELAEKVGTVPLISGAPSGAAPASAG